MIFRNIMTYLLLVSISMHGAEMPPKPIKKSDIEIIMPFVKKPASNNNFYFYKQKPRNVLEDINAIAEGLLQDANKLTLYAGAFGMNEQTLKARLSNVITHSNRALYGDVPVPKVSTVVSASADQPINQGDLIFIKKFLEPKRNTDLNFYKTRPRRVLEVANSLAERILNNVKELDFLRKELNMSSGSLTVNLLHIVSYSKQALDQIPPTLPSAPVGKVFQEEHTPLQVEFSNQTSDKIITAWVAEDPNNTWDLITLLPYQDSKVLSPAKESSMHLYTESEGFLLMQKDNSLILAKKALTDKYKGNLVSPYVGTQEIKKINLKDPARIIVIINPDSSISFAEKP